MLDATVVRRTFRALASLIMAGALIATAGAAPNGLSAVLTSTQWLNGRADAASVAGKVVIVEVFTFDCINCKHVVPNLRRLHAHVPAADLAIIGVHSPETPAERERGNVVDELARQGVVWPVAVDNSFELWKALGNTYWPTQYIYDRSGVLRKTIVGEGQDDVVNATVRSLIDQR